MLYPNLIPVSELAPGDVIVVRRNERTGRPVKTTKVATIEYGATCRGVHVNVKYGPQTMDVKQGGRTVKVPHPMATAIMSSDGCYHRAASIDVLPS